MPGLNCWRLNNQNAVYTQVSRGNVFTCTSVRAAILKNLKAKSSDKVKAPQKWPHAHLQYEFVNKEVKFEDLDYRLFIAGELEVISESSISSSERQGRINLLKKIVYYTGVWVIYELRVASC